MGQTSDQEQAEQDILWPSAQFHKTPRSLVEKHTQEPCGHSPPHKPAAQHPCFLRGPLTKTAHLGQARQQLLARAVSEQEAPIRNAVLP